MGAIPAGKGRGSLPFRKIVILFLYTTGCLLSAPGTASAQKNQFRLVFEKIAIDTSLDAAGLTADFPYPVMSVLSVLDASNHYVHGLAHTERWLSADSTTQSGRKVSDVWQTLLEYHADNPSEPPNPDVKVTSPGFLVTEQGDIKNVGITVSMVMDYSGSMYDYFTAAEEAAKVYVQEMGRADRVSVYKFSKDCFQMNAFTNDKPKLYEVIDRDSTKMDGTYLYDAIWRALDDIKLEPGRRAIIAYTDGRDHLKGHSREDLIQYAKAEKIPVYTIGLPGTGIRNGPLEEIAAWTGGIYYYAPSIDSLKSIYRKIKGVISGYYVIAHASPDPFTNGKKRVFDATVSTEGKTLRDTIHFQVPFIPPNLEARARVSGASGTPGVLYVPAGDTVSFAIGARNAGRGAAKDALLKFIPGDSLAVLSASPEPDSVRNGAWFWSAARVVRGDSLAARVSARLSPRMPQGDTPVTSSVFASCVDDSLSSDNAASAVLYGMGRPDFSVRLDPVASVASPGYAVRVTGTVFNAGNAPASSPFEVRLSHAGSGALLGTFAVPSLAGSDSAAVEFETSFARSGRFPLRLAADPDGLVPELDETDNADTAFADVGVVTFAAQLSDFSVTEALRGLQAHFPDRVLATVSVMDQNGHPVRGLADTTRWLAENDDNLLGEAAGEVWAALSEIHEEQPAYPPVTDVRPGFAVTETEGAAAAVALALDASQSGPDVMADLDPWVAGFDTGDRAAVIGFSGSVQTLRALTSDVPSIRSALNYTRSGSSRRLYDALYAGVESVRGAAGRNAVLAVTAGEDAGSGRTADEVLRFAQDSGVPLLIVAHGTAGEPAGLRALAEGSGGWFRHSGGGADTVAFEDALRFMDESLRHFYTLAFASSDTTEDRTRRRVMLRLDAFGLSAADTGVYRSPQGPANLALDVTARGASFTAAGGDTTWFARTGERVRYAVRVRNIGHRALSDIHLSDVLPATFRPDAIPFAHEAAGDSITWTLDALPLRATAIFEYAFRADTLFSFDDVPLGNRARARCALDSVPYDDADSDTVWYVPLKPPDFRVNVSGRADSSFVLDGDTTWVARANSLVHFSVTLTNVGELACPAISVTNVLPDSATLVEFTGASPAQRGDSLFWDIDLLPSRGGTRSFAYTCKVDSLLPPWEIRLISAAWARSDSENQPAGNSDADTVIVAPLIAPAPQVRVSPGTVEPGDTVRVEFLSPVSLKSYDFVILYENGERDDTYGDAFIAANPFPAPGDWFRVDPAFGDTRMRTDETRERVGVAVFTTDRWDVTRSDTAFFTLQSNDAFFLDRNLFRPAAGEPVGIRFKLASNRRVALTVVDASGAFVASVADGRYPAGWNEAAWDGRDASGRAVGGGVYVALIRAEDFRKALKFIVVR